MDMKFEMHSGIGIVHIEGILDASVAEAFNKEFNQMFQKSNSFVFNLSLLEFLDSAGLGRLVHALKRVTSKNGEIKLACIPERVMMIFQITRAFQIFDIYDSVEEAINSFK